MRKLIALFFMLAVLVSPLAAQAAFFTDGFESGDLTHTENNANWFGSDNTSVSTDTARTGSYSLKFTHGTTAGSHAEQRFDLGNPKDEVWIQYWFKFPSNYDDGDGTPQGNNNKFLRLWSDNAEYSGDSGKVGASIWQGDPYGSLEPDANKTYSGGWQFDCNGNIGSVASLSGMGKWDIDASDLNRWIKFKWRFRRDTGVGDGAMGLWIDDVQIYHKQNISYLNAPCPEYYLTGYLMGADNSDPATTMYYYIDDFSLSNEDPGSGGGDGTPPVISSPLPSGQQECTSDPRDITLQITTDENATCKWNGQDVAYDNMNWTFNTTGGTSHSHTLSGMNCGGSWMYYARCRDGSGNTNVVSTEISFSIADGLSPISGAAMGGGAGSFLGGGSGQGN